MVCARCDDDFILIYPVLIKCDIYDQLLLSVQVWNCPCFVESAVACMRSSHDRLMETNSCRPDRGSKTMATIYGNQRSKADFVWMEFWLLRCQQARWWCDCEQSSGRSSKLALLIISLAPKKKRGRVVIGTVLHTLPFLHAPVMTDVWR